MNNDRQNEQDCAWLWVADTWLLLSGQYMIASYIVKITTLF